MKAKNRKDEYVNYHIWDENANEDSKGGKRIRQRHIQSRQRCSLRQKVLTTTCWVLMITEALKYRWTMEERIEDNLKMRVNWKTMNCQESLWLSLPIAFLHQLSSYSPCPVNLNSPSIAVNTFIVAVITFTVANLVFISMFLLWFVVSLFLPIPRLVSPLIRIHIFKIRVKCFSQLCLFNLILCFFTVFVKTSHVTCMIIITSI